MFPVNAIAFNSRGTFATAGGDGMFSFWDKEAKSRIKEFKTEANSCRAAQVSDAQTTKREREREREGGGGGVRFDGNRETRELI